ncbi:unnamed protein product [Pseudo-nitzschia multistriata]|uniref:Sugar fermentation stimulation protein C-terminal domain-containing protein n=1 Tax=Pseudo-nitzschia multistriata TaxID=183589 RepID=A0A448Z6E0_9STRA|nr:unnamed protein product [Pseudo-nitzschia multistriata]
MNLPLLRNRSALLIAAMVVTRSQKRRGLASVAGFSPRVTRQSKTALDARSTTAKKSKKPVVSRKKSSKPKKRKTSVAEIYEELKPKTPKQGTIRTVKIDDNNSQSKGSGNADTVGSNLLLSLPEDTIVAELRKRPSRRNRSPYVGDVWLEDEQREAIVHLPNLDMGGKCVPGAKLLLKPARDKKGNLVGKDAVNPKYGTPKCEFIAQLLRYDESDLGYEPAWVGAHPSLGEKIAEELVGRNLLGPEFPKVKSYKREVRNVGGTDMRADFLVEHEDSSLPPRILEVKTVVDTDYSKAAIPDRSKCIFTSDEEPYRRTAIFPWGSSKQKGPDGEAVVSARAIKHVRELTRMISDETKDFDCTVLFVVIRHDAKAFRPNIDACPSFARYIREAKDAGVQVLAKQVIWGEETEELGKCYEGKLLDIVWP